MKHGYAITTALVLLVLSLVTLPAVSCTQSSPAPASPPQPTQQPALTPSPSATTPIKLIVSTWTPGIARDTVNVQAWADKVTELTDGRVQCEVYVAGALGTPPGHFDMAVKRIADVTFYSPSVQRGRFPLSELLQWPFLIPSGVDGTKMFATLYNEFEELRDELKQVKVIGLGTEDPYFLHSTQKAGPICTLEDFKGKKIKVTGITADVTEALGGAPTAVAASETYVAFQKGILDAGVGAFTSFLDFKSYEVNQYFTMWEGGGLGTIPWFICMNLDTWKSLPTDIQKIIDSKLTFQSPSYASWVGGLYDDHAKKAIKFIKDAGGKFCVVPAAEIDRWKKKVQPVTDKWISDLEAKGMPANKYIDRALKLAKSYN